MSGDMAWWQQILIYVFAPTGVLATTLNLTSKYSRKKKLRSGYGDIHKAQVCIQDLLCSTESNRVMLFRSENGGGIPKPGSIVRNNAIAEACDSAVKPMLKAWQEILADRNYSRILHQLLGGDGFSDIETRVVSSGSELRELLEIAECSSVRFIRVCALTEAVIYLGVFYADGYEPGAEERFTMRTSALFIRGLFKKHHSLIEQESPKH